MDRTAPLSASGRSLLWSHSRSAHRISGRPFYDGDPKSLRDDKVFQPNLEEMHGKLMEALNAGRPENERVTLRAGMEELQ
jgi:hypothetical protein